MRSVASAPSRLHVDCRRVMNGCSSDQRDGWRRMVVPGRMAIWGAGTPPMPPSALAPPSSRNISTAYSGRTSASPITSRVGAVIALTSSADQPGKSIRACFIFDEDRPAFWMRRRLHIHLLHRRSDKRCWRHRWPVRWWSDRSHRCWRVLDDGELHEIESMAAPAPPGQPSCGRRGRPARRQADRAGQRHLPPSATQSTGVMSRSRRLLPQRPQGRSSCSRTPQPGQ